MDSWHPTSPCSMQTELSWVATPQQTPRIRRETRSVSPALSYGTPQAKDTGFRPIVMRDDLTHRDSEPCSMRSVRAETTTEGNTRMVDVKEDNLLKILPRRKRFSFRIARPVFLIPQRFREKHKKNIVLSPHSSFSYIDELRVLQSALMRRQLMLERISELHELDEESSKGHRSPSWVPQLAASRRGSQNIHLASPPDPTCHC
mmetsp:Transcript_37034/g.68359  ORF Transcript_37034/g.68359 Transcript_37034/m.68359 type:complete len:203 (-) Transcript_37034:188-796(-)